MVYPVANLIYLSFHDYSPLRSADADWVGVENYTVAVTEPATRDFALDDRRLHRLQRRYRTGPRDCWSPCCWRASRSSMAGGSAGCSAALFAGGFILPFAIPAVTAAVIWKMFLDPQIGPVDALIGSPILGWRTIRC